jgi:hypothetical protein
MERFEKLWSDERKKRLVELREAENRFRQPFRRRNDQFGVLRGGLIFAQSSGACT